MQRAPVVAIALCAVSLVIAYVLSRAGDAGASDGERAAIVPDAGDAADVRSAVESPASETRAPVRGEGRESSGEDPTAVSATAPAHDERAETLDARLDRIAETFRSADPDFAGLAKLWDEISENVAIVPGSVVSEHGRTAGRLSIAGSELTASFVLEDGACRVSIDSAPESNGDGLLVSRSMVLSFKEGAAGSSIVQFHPDTSRSASDVLAGEKLVVGWRVSSRGGEILATELSARQGDNGRSWIIGPTEGQSPMSAGYGPDGRAEHAFLSAIRSAAGK